MNTIADLAWAAGIIDGEGSIFVMKQKRKDRERDHNYIMRLSVQSTDPYMTKELCKLFPDGAVFTQEVDKKPQNSDTLKWQISGRVKHEQAKLALDFQETTKKHWRHMLDVDYELQEQFYFKLKQAKVDLKIGKHIKEIN